MPSKFIFVPSEYIEASGNMWRGDPMIHLKEGQEGVVDFLLIGRDNDLLYYNGKIKKDSYDVFNPSFSSQGKLPRMRMIDENKLEAISGELKIPVEELKEIKDIESNNYLQIIETFRKPIILL